MLNNECYDYEYELATKHDIFLDVDSTYRNRNEYSHSADFVLGSTANADILDPLFLSSAYNINNIGQVVAGSDFSFTVVTLSAGEINVIGFYTSQYLEIEFPVVETRKIISYNNTSKEATVESPFTADPSGFSYKIRKELPLYRGEVFSSVNNTINLGGSAPNIDNYFDNCYIHFLNPASDLFGKIIKIISYNSTSKDLSLEYLPSTPLPYPNESFEILILTRDNYRHLSFNKSISNSEFEVELLSISIPLKMINVPTGGTIKNYPYLYVRLYNEGYIGSTQVSYSNNPNSVYALFNVPVDGYLGATSFSVLNNCQQKQRIRIFPNTNLRMSVSTPEGQILKFQEEDMFSPNEPNPFLQISALFKLREILEN